MDLSWRHAASFPHLLREKAHDCPDVVAFRFVHDDGSAEEVTYSQLDRWARAIASRLTGSGPALLLFAPGVDYLTGLIGCFYAGVPAVPAYPPGATRLPRTMSRLMAIVEDAQADLVLTTAKIASTLDGPFPTVLATDLIGDDGAGLEQAVAADAIAL